MSWSLRVWTKAFVCRLKAKLIMRENLTGKLSLDFQENISEIRKLPLSFHFPEEDVNWSEMVILVEFWPKLALYWLYCQLFSVKAKRKKKKWVRRSNNQTNTRPRFFGGQLLWKPGYLHMAYAFCEGDWICWKYSLSSRWKTNFCSTCEPLTRPNSCPSTKSIVG